MRAAKPERKKAMATHPGNGLALDGSADGAVESLTRPSVPSSGADVHAADRCGGARIRATPGLMPRAFRASMVSMVQREKNHDDDGPDKSGSPTSESAADGSGSGADELTAREAVIISAAIHGTHLVRSYQWTGGTKPLGELPSPLLEHFGQNIQREFRDEALDHLRQWIRILQAVKAAPSGGLRISPVLREEQEEHRARCWQSLAGLHYVSLLNGLVALGDALRDEPVGRLAVGHWPGRSSSGDDATEGPAIEPTVDVSAVGLADLLAIREARRVAESGVLELLAEASLVELREQWMSHAPQPLTAMLSPIASLADLFSTAAARVPVEPGGPPLASALAEPFLELIAQPGFLARYGTETSLFLGVSGLLVAAAAAGRAELLEPGLIVLLSGARWAEDEEAAARADWIRERAVAYREHFWPGIEGCEFEVIWNRCQQTAKQALTEQYRLLGTPASSPSGISVRDWTDPEHWGESTAALSVRGWSESAPASTDWLVYEPARAARSLAAYLAKNVGAISEPSSAAGEVDDAIIAVCGLLCQLGVGSTVDSLRALDQNALSPAVAEAVSVAIAALERAPAEQGYPELARRQLFESLRRTH